MKHILYKLACWVDKSMHNVMHNYNPFTCHDYSATMCIGQLADWLHHRAHDLAYLCREE